MFSTPLTPPVTGNSFGNYGAGVPGTTHNRARNLFQISNKSELLTKKRDEKLKVKKGFIANYLTEVANEQLVQNTLTGFLIGLFRQKGNLMSFGDILGYTEERFEFLRKPNGKPYESKSTKRSLICALSSNGLFVKTTITPAVYDNSSSS